MGKTIVFVYTFAEELEPDYFFKYRACVPVYVTAPNRSYLAINVEWFSKYVGNELVKVKDCYIAECSPTAVNKIFLLAATFPILKKMYALNCDQHSLRLDQFRIAIDCSWMIFTISN